MIDVDGDLMTIIERFVIKTNGTRKRRFDRSTVIIKQSEDKNFHKY